MIARMLYTVKARLYLAHFFLKNHSDLMSKVYAFFLKYGDYRKRSNLLLCFFYSVRRSENLSTMSRVTSIRSLSEHDHKKLWAKSRYWNIAAHHDNTKMINELRECAKKLSVEVKKIRDDGGCVILAPLHMESDYLASLVAAFVKPHHATVMSINNTYYQQKDEAEKMRTKKIIIDRFNIGSKQTSSQKSLNNVLSNACRNITNLVIFPDALPEVTVRFSDVPMKTKDITLFGRSGKIHCGLDVLSRRINAAIVYYYLYDDGDCVNIHIEKSVAADLNTKKMPFIIESALKRNPQSWLLWHSSSFYFFNSGQ